MPEDRKSWGAGRVAFLGRLDQINADLAIGVPLRTIHEKHQAALGIGYTSFCRLVSRYAADAKPAVQNPAPRQPRHAIRSSPAPAPTQPARTPVPTEGTRNAGLNPASRNFEYDPSPKQDDKERLIGPGRKKE